MSSLTVFIHYFNRLIKHVFIALLSRAYGMLLTIHRQFMLHCLVVGGDIASRHFELVPLSSNAQKLVCWIENSNTLLATHFTSTTA